MRSMRYALRQFYMSSYVSVCNALKYHPEDKENQFSVEFSEQDTAGMEVITKMNSLLYQAMEKVESELHPDYRTAAPSHHIIDRFIDQVVIVIWPTEDNDRFFSAENAPDQTLNGFQLRKNMFCKGFKMGGRTMLPLLAGAGMAREGKMMFICSRYRSRVLEIITNGLVKDEKLTLADEDTISVCKLMAYIGLASSDGQSLSELLEIGQKALLGDEKKKQRLLKIWGGEDRLQWPKESMKNICVVDDVKAAFKANGYTHQMTNDMENSKNNAVNVIVKKLADSEMANVTDGYGFISPEWADTISELRRVRRKEEKNHSAYIIRMPFVKGALLRIDFKRYFRERGIDTIKDKWGIEHSVEEIEIILTTSMYKGHKWFDDWNAYMTRYQEYGLSMTIVGADSPSDGSHDVGRLNYQFLSTLQPKGTILEHIMAVDLSKQKEKFRLLEHENEWIDRKSTHKIKQFLKEDGKNKEEISEFDENADPGADEKESRGEDKGEAPETENETDDRSEGESYSEKLADVLDQYPEIARTRLVKEAFAQTAVSVAMHVSRGRPMIRKTCSRMLIGDPFMLLASICERSDRGRQLRDSDRDFLVGGRQCFAYAPGIREERILLLRNPHVSPLECIVGKNLIPDDESRKGNPAYSKYHDYLKEATGIVFVHAIQAAGLGGADFDGDRVRIIYDDMIVKLAAENEEKVIRLLAEEMNLSGAEKNQRMPVLTITGKSPQSDPVKAINERFWEKMLSSHSKSISTQVGLMSIKAAEYMFTCGKVLFDDQPAQNEQPEAALTSAKAQKKEDDAGTVLNNVVTMACAIGLDIDSAKTGYVPAMPKLGTSGNAATPVLKFSRYVRQHGSKSFKGIDLYHSARAFACSESKMESVPAGKELVLRFDLTEHAEVLEKWKPLGREKYYKKPAEGSEAEISFVDLMIERFPLSEGEEMTRALREAGRKLKEWEQHKSAMKKMSDAIRNMNRRREEIYRYLLTRYPLYAAAKLYDDILKGRAPEKQLPLYKNEDVIVYAVQTNEERRNSMREEIFGADCGDEAGARFRYTADCYQLAKQVRRYRNSCAELEEVRARLLPREAAVMVTTDAKRAELEKIAEIHQVNAWKMGLRLLKRGSLSEMMFILIFADKCPAPVERGKTC